MRGLGVCVLLALCAAAPAAAGPARSTAPEWASHNRSARQHITPNDALGLPRTLEDTGLVAEGPVLVVERRNAALFTETLLASVTVPKPSPKLTVEVSLGRESRVELWVSGNRYLIPVQVIGDADASIQSSIARVVADQHAKKRGLFDVPTKLIADAKRGSVRVELSDGSKQDFDQATIRKLPVRTSEIAIPRPMQYASR